MPASVACSAAAVVLVLMVGAPIAEGSQSTTEAQPKPVAALLGTVAATVDQVAGQQVPPAPAAVGSAQAPSPVETVVSAATGQSAAPGLGAPSRSDASEGPAGAAPRRSAPDAGATLRKVAEPVRRVARGVLHGASQSVGGVVAQVPVVGQPARRVAGSIVTGAGDLLAKTPLAPAVTQTSVLLAETSGGGALTGLAGEPSPAGAAGFIASSVPATMIAAPGETSACVPCTAGGPAGIPGSTVATIAAASAPGVGSSAARPGASLAAGSVPTSSSPFHMPSMPRSPSPGGGVTSAAGGVAVGAGLALALAWLLATVLPGVARRLGEGPRTRLIAPFELILQRPG
ncbi:MAG TPA: hypothetical protein VH061_05245 [Solirubrobacteraceae bacterium]|jgi:hypothetical protein|nr:hypothetical protein [Solirubrobacteraceae bacterium]